MGHPCLGNIKDRSLVKHLLDRSGLPDQDSYTSEEIQKLIKASEEIQAEDISSLKDMYRELKVKGFEQPSTPSQEGEDAKQKVRVTAGQLEERQPEKIKQRYVDDLNTVEDSKFDWRVKSELSSADRKKAVEDIKNGKETAATRKLNKETDDMLERGTVIINRGRGTQAETVEIPIDEWFKFTPIEHNEAMKEAENAPEEVISIIQNEGITLQNIDNLKDLFNGFPYDQTDFTAVKNYLSAETTRNAEIKRVGEKSQVQTVNETLQTTSEGTQPVSPEEKSNSKKLATEAGDGAKEPPRRADAAEFEVGGDDITGITHAQTEATRERFSLPEYERESETIAKWDAEAEQAIKDGYNIESLLAKMERGGIPTAVEQRIMLRYIATLEAKVEKNPSDENLSELKKAIQLSDRVGGSIVGKSLAARKGSIHRDDSLASFFIREMEESEVDVLTEEQKEKVKKEFEEIKAANAAYKKKIEELQKEIARLKAEAEISKQKRTGSTKRKTHEEYTQERKNIAEDIKEKLKKARQNTQVTILPYANDLIAIAPDVAKLMKSYVSEGVDKLSDIIDNIHEILKDHIPEITTKDVQDIIAGEYTEQKKTRNELAAQLRDLKTEAQLLNQYEKLEQGEIPNNEKKKIQRNQKLTELRTKIKEHNLTRLSEAKERIKRQIEKIEGQIRTGDFAVQKKKQPIKLDKEGQELQDKLIKLKQDREVRILKERYENRSAKDRAIDKVIEVANVPRSIMASMDYSAPLRQAIIATIAHPRTALMAAREMFISSFSQKNFDRWFFDLKNDPNYTLMQDSGLSVTDPHSPFLTAKEEAYMNNLSEKIPIIGRLIKGSERAYVQYLNKMRVDLFNRFSDRFAEQGKTFENSAELYKKMAEYINNQTGRGKMGKLEEYAPVLNTLFFSPRLISSRLNLLNPVYFAKLPKELKAMYAKDMLKFLGVGLGVLALAKFSSGDDDENKVTVETDPRSSDFMKLRQKNTRWDVWGGFQPYVRLIAQMITGQTKSANSGKIYEIDGKGAFGRDRADLLKTFFRNKLAPIPSGVINVLSGKSTVGEDVTIGSQVKEYFTPLNYTGIKEGIQDEGVKALFTVGIPSTFGIGVQTYEPRKPKQETIKVFSKEIEGEKGVRGLTPEEDTVYQNRRQEIKQDILSNVKKDGVPIDKYDRISFDIDLITGYREWDDLSVEEKKDVESRLGTSSAEYASKEIPFSQQEPVDIKELKQKRIDDWQDKKDNMQGRKVTKKKL